MEELRIEKLQDDKLQVVIIEDVTEKAYEIIEYLKKYLERDSYNVRVIRNKKELDLFMDDQNNKDKKYIKRIDLVFCDSMIDEASFNHKNHLDEYLKYNKAGDKLRSKPISVFDFNGEWFPGLRLEDGCYMTGDSNYSYCIPYLFTFLKNKGKVKLGKGYEESAKRIEQKIKNIKSTKNIQNKIFKSYSEAIKKIEEVKESFKSYRNKIRKKIEEKNETGVKKGKKRLDKKQIQKRVDGEVKGRKKYFDKEVLLKLYLSGILAEESVKFENEYLEILNKVKQKLEKTEKYRIFNKEERYSNLHNSENKLDKNFIKKMLKDYEINKKIEEGFVYIDKKSEWRNALRDQGGFYTRDGEVRFIQ